MVYAIKDVNGHELYSNSIKKARELYCHGRTCENCKLSGCNDTAAIPVSCDKASQKELLRRFGGDIRVINNVQLSNNDPVNHPSHYTTGGIECIDAIEAALTCQTNPIRAWYTGQIFKYLWRWPMKNGLEDLKKAQFYLNKLIEKVEGKDN